MGDSGRRRGVFALLRNVLCRDSILARTTELLATLRSFRGFTAPPSNLRGDLTLDPLHTAFYAVYCVIRRVVRRIANSESVAPRTKYALVEQGLLIGGG